MSKTWQTWRWLLLTLAVVILLSGGLYWQLSQPRVLRIGIVGGSLWGVPQNDAYAVLDNVIARFEQQHPGVQVKCVHGITQEDYPEWLAEQLLAGSAPDVFLILPDDFKLYAGMGALKDLTGYAKQDPDIDMDNYYPAALAYGQHDGHLYALPGESVPTLMFVNKTLLAREGIPMPQDDWTWEDFLRISRQVTRDTDGDGVLDQFGSYGYNWQLAAVANDAPAFREDGRASYFADGRMEEAVQFLMQLQGLNGERQVTLRDFELGHVAFRPMSFAEYRAYKPYPWRIKKYSTFAWDCVRLPQGPHGTGQSPMATMLMGMSAQTSQPELAWQLLKLLCYDAQTQQQLLTDSQGLPSRRDILEDSASQELLQEQGTATGMKLQRISQVMANASEEPRFPKYHDALLLANVRLQQIISGNVPYNNALNKLQKEINAYLQQ